MNESLLATAVIVMAAGTVSCSHKTQQTTGNATAVKPVAIEQVEVVGMETVNSEAEIPAEIPAVTGSRQTQPEQARK